MRTPNGVMSRLHSSLPRAPCYIKSQALLRFSRSSISSTLANPLLSSTVVDVQEHPDGDNLRRPLDTASPNRQPLSVTASCSVRSLSQTSAEHNTLSRTRNKDCERDLNVYEERRACSAGDYLGE